MAKAVERDAGGPMWEHAGNICTGEIYKTAVKLTLTKGAALKDPSSLFNVSLEGNTRRAAHSRRRSTEHVLGRATAGHQIIDDRKGFETAPCPGHAPSIFVNRA